MKKIHEIIKGLEILSKYSDVVDISHYELIVHLSDFPIIPEVDVRALEDHHWLFDDDMDCWSIRVV